MSSKAIPCCLLLALVLGPAPGRATPGSEANPAAARVAAQCAAFWSGAGETRQAARFRTYSVRVGGDAGFTDRFIARYRPAMARLAEDATKDPRAAALWARHAALCNADPSSSSN